MTLLLSSVLFSCTEVFLPDTISDPDRNVLRDIVNRIDFLFAS